MDGIQKWRVIILMAMFVGYSSYYVARKTFPYVMPLFLERDTDRHNGISLTKSEFGFITSSFFIAYAISKFVAGYLSDRFGAKMLFSSALAASGLLNLLIMAFARSPAMLCLLWSVNGFVQGFGWPPCAQLIYSWYDRTKAGTMWSILTVSCTLTPTLLPVVYTKLTLLYHWQSCFLFAGVWAIIISILLIPAIHNKPSDVGLANIENESASKTNSLDGNIGLIAALKLVCQQPLLPYLAASYFMSSFAKCGLENWIQLFVMEEFSGSHQSASLVVSMFQLGGTLGSLSAGFISDWLSHSCKLNGSRFSNPRLPVLVCFTILMLLSYIGCHLAPTVAVLYVCSASAGFATYGPHALYGLLATESAAAGLRGTSHATATVASQVGVFFAGYPLSVLLSYFGWTYHFLCLEIAIILNVACVIGACYVNPKPRSKVE